jgi:LacI family transcriptional regulator
MARGRTGLVALVLPYVHSDYFARISGAAAESLYEEDARFVLCPTHHLHDREVSLLDRVMHGTTDGAVLLLPSESEVELEQLRRQGYPFVVVDPMLPLSGDVPVVAAAHWSGARALVEHLIGLGHERIGAITGNAGWAATKDRLGSYLSCLAAAGLPSPREFIREGHFTVESGYESARDLLSLAEPPTAIFAFNDNMAVGALQAARELGIRVPEDVSIVGFDDLEIASVTDPPLTTVRQPLEEMGRIAASLLMRLLQGGRLEANRLELSTRLIVRESTAPPRTRAAVRTA